MKWNKFTGVILVAIGLVMSTQSSRAADLVIAQNGKTTATVVVSPEAGPWEKRAAEDLQKYIEMMTGAKPALANTVEANATALQGADAVLVVGAAALKAEPDLQKALAKVAKKDPVLRSDAVSYTHLTLPTKRIV